MVPLNLQDLRDKARDWGLPVNSSQIPGVPVYKFYARDARGTSRNFRPLQVAWGIREDKEDRWGIGILPLVEILGGIDSSKFPSRNALEKEMVKMLRSFVAQAQYETATNLGEALQSQDKPECPAAKVVSSWPKFKEWTETRQSPSTPAPSSSGSSTTENSSTPGNDHIKLMEKAQPAIIKQTQHSKYSSTHGLFTSASLDNEIPDDIKEMLVDNANASLAYQTWRSIKSVKRRVVECERETSRDLSLPWSQVQLAIFRRINRLNDQARLREDMANTAQKWISGGVLVH